MYNFQLDFGGDIRCDVASVGDITGTLHLDAGDVLVVYVRHPVVWRRTHASDVTPERISGRIPITAGSDDPSFAGEEGLKNSDVIGLGITSETP